ncbi:hypothetical protein AAMO2058_001676300 [Amorphochlora amoebiformis]
MWFPCCNTPPEADLDEKKKKQEGRKDGKKNVICMKARTRAMVKVGLEVYHGDGIFGIDETKGINLVIEAMKKGDKVARGICLFNKWGGLEWDRKKAIETIFKPLAEEGNPIAQYYMGLYLWGPSNYNIRCPEALEWFRKSAKQGNVRAMISVGKYLFHHPGEVENHHQNYIDWFKKATKMGSGEGMARLGSVYLSVSMGHHIGQFLLAEYYEKRDLMSHTQALKFYRRCAISGLEMDRFSTKGYERQTFAWKLADYYLNASLGLTKDPDEAVYWSYRCLRSVGELVEYRGMRGDTEMLQACRRYLFEKSSVAKELATLNLEGLCDDIANAVFGPV